MTCDRHEILRVPVTSNIGKKEKRKVEDKDIKVFLDVTERTGERRTGKVIAHVTDERFFGRSNKFGTILGKHLHTTSHLFKGDGTISKLHLYGHQNILYYSKMFLHSKETKKSRMYSGELYCIKYMY